MVKATDSSFTLDQMMDVFTKYNEMLATTVWEAASMSINGNLTLQHSQTCLS